MSLSFDEKELLERALKDDSGSSLDSLIDLSKQAGNNLKLQHKLAVFLRVELQSLNRLVIDAVIFCVCTMTAFGIFRTNPEPVWALNIAVAYLLGRISGYGHGVDTITLFMKSALSVVTAKFRQRLKV